MIVYSAEHAGGGFHPVSTSAVYDSGNEGQHCKWSDDNSSYLAGQKQAPLANRGTRALGEQVI